MIFVSVGTLHGFDRLIKGVDDAIGQGLIQEEVYAQIWSGSYVPQNCAWVRSMDRIIFLDYVKKSSCIISHAGMGVITLALEYRKPTLVMPRCKKYGEHVNDHQVRIAEIFAERGHVLLAREVADLPREMEKLKSFTPVQRSANAQPVVEKVRSFLDAVRL